MWKKCWMLLAGAMVATPMMAQKTLRYSEDGSPSTLDPVQAATTYSNTLVTAVYDTLYEYRYLAEPYELQANLAAGLPEVSADGLTYTIKLKKAVRFKDDPAFPGGKGREVVAQDFVYSIKRHFDKKNRSQGSWLWRGRIQGLDAWKAAGSDYKKQVIGLRATDSHTVEIKLTKPFPQITYTLAMGFAAVVPREAVEHYGREFAVKPVGSGAFQMESFTPKKAILVRNPHYRQEKFDLKAVGYQPEKHKGLGFEKLQGRSLPIVDRVELSFIQQQVSRWNSFTKGSEIQFTTLPDAQVERVLANKSPVTLKTEFADKYHMISRPEFGFVYSGFNMAKPEFGYHKDPEQNRKNKALRCAVREAFSWQQRIDRFYYGIGKPFAGVIPPSLAGYTELDQGSVTQDLKKAKQMLKQAGWTPSNLPVFEYSGTGSVTNMQFYEQMRGFLRKMGYPRQKIKFKKFATFGDYNKAMKQSKLKFIGLGWGLDYPDAENLTQLFYGPNGSPGSNNTNYNNPEFNKLYEQSAVMQDSPERTAIFKRMNQILIDDCVVISGFSRMKIFMWHKDVVMYPIRNPHGNIFKYVDVL